MKKVFVFAFAAMLLTGSAFAVNPNLSIDYVRMLSRYATVNSADAAYYNPAGLPKIENGLYLSLSNQFIYKKYGFKLSGQEWNYNTSDSQWTFFFPSASVTFKQKNWAVFFNFTAPDGGGGLVYENIPAAMIPAIADRLQPAISLGLLSPAVLGYPLKIDASSSWLEFAVGGSYAINKYIALSLGARFLIPNSSTKMTPGTLLAGIGVPSSETSEKGLALAGQFGINITPVEKLTIGVLYKSQAYFFKNDNDVFYTPNTISAGIGYDVIENLNVQFGYKINLESLTPDMPEKYGNSMDFSLGAEYQINKFIKPSLGVAYQMNRQTDKINNPFNPDLNAFVIGAGAVITPVKNLDVTVGYMYPLFFAETFNTIELAKAIQLFGIGVSYKFF